MLKGDFVQTKISVLGHFGEGKNLLNGQTVKTRIITDELQRRLGKENVSEIDTHGGWKALLKAPFQVALSFIKSKNIIIFPAQNGLRVYAPLLYFCRKVFRSRKLHYVVIGGWLPKFLNDRKKLANIIRHFDGVYVETNTMKKALEKQEFGNVYVLPNCKKLTVLSEKELIYPDNAPYRLCTFSRVMKEKGIEDAVNAVEAVNNELGYRAFSLDIYGQVDTGQTDWFDELKRNFPEYIRYCGCVDADKSVGILQNYFSLLFPTRFYTEGIPGTVIDAYAAGIPVISAKWESFSDIVDEGKTGVGFDFENYEQLKSVLMSAANNTQKFIDMKKACIKKAKDYSPETVVGIMTEKF